MAGFARVTDLAQRETMRSPGIALGAGLLAVCLGSVPADVFAGGRSHSVRSGGHGHAFHRSFGHRSFIAYASPAFVYAPPVFYDPLAYAAPVDAVPPAYSVAPTYSAAPAYAAAPAYSMAVYDQPASTAVVPPPPPPPPQPTVVQYSSGRYELRGDGTATPYHWVWVPNPPPPPTAARETTFYQWVDERGILHITNQWDSVPQQHRDQAKRNQSS